MCKTVTAKTTPAKCIGPSPIDPIMQLSVQLYHYQTSTGLRYQRFENCLEDEHRVGTPIRQSLTMAIFFLLLLDDKHN